MILSVFFICAIAIRTRFFSLTSRRMATESYVGFDIKQQVVFKPHNTCISFFAGVYLFFRHFTSE